MKNKDYHDYHQAYHYLCHIQMNRLARLVLFVLEVDRNSSYCRCLNILLDQFVFEQCQNGKDLLQFHNSALLYLYLVAVHNFV